MNSKSEELEELEEDLGSGWMQIPDLEAVSWTRARRYLYPSYLFGVVTLAVAWLATREVLYFNTSNIVQDAGVSTTVFVLLSILLGNGVGLFVTGKLAEMIIELRKYGRIIQSSERETVDQLNLIILWLVPPLVLVYLFDILNYYIQGGLL